MRDESKEKDGLTVNEYEPFDISDLQKKNITIISSECALKDVIPIDWNNTTIPIQKDDN